MFLDQGKRMNQCNFAFYLQGQSAYHPGNNQDGFYRKTIFFWLNTENILLVSALGGTVGVWVQGVFECVRAALAMWLNCEAPSAPSLALPL